MQLQKISDSEGYGWEVSFHEWARDGYDSVAFETIDWVWWEGLFERAFELMENLNETKHIGRWIGTDILQHESLVQRGYVAPFHAATILVADAPNLVQEAKELTGRDVDLVRSIPPETYQATPITRWDNILSYIPTGREDFFRFGWILDMAADYPDITFNILARSETPKDHPNVRAIPEVQGEEKRALFERCFGYLRPIQHDGIGLTLIEMAQLGRYIFHSDTSIPFVGPARSVGEIEYGIDRILAEKKQPDAKIADYYRSEYSEAKLTEDVARLHANMEAIG